MAVTEISKKDAKRIILERSMLYKPAKSVTEVVRALSCLQVDPIRVKMRNHEWILYNRLKKFTPEDLDIELYKNRSLFEYWMQLYSIIPMEDFPYIRIRHQATEGWREIFEKGHKKQLAEVMAYIRDNGPTSSQDTPHIKPGKDIFSWTSSTSRTSLFQFLWDKGQLMIHHRVHNRKFYDLTERIVPPEIYNKEVTVEESYKFLFSKFLDYITFARRPFLNRIRFGYSRSIRLVTLIESELEEGNIVPVKIEGAKSQYYIKKEYLELLNQAKPRFGAEPIYMAPLDPVVIDRQLLQDVFGFTYLWEVYTPPQKRKVGYYNMPILEKGNIEKQIDMSISPLNFF